MTQMPPSGKNLADRDLALRGGPVLDIPPRVRRLLFLGGAAGVVLILIGSLVGNRPETIPVDKLIHFTGYATLAALFVLALRPRLYVPALLGLAALGYLIELVQPLNQRSLDPADAVANTLGIVIGAMAGLVGRLVYGYVKTELEAARVRRSLFSVEAGTTIVHAGAPIERFFIIKRGTVALVRETEGTPLEVARLGPGEMFGLLAEILRTPQYITAVAVTPVQIYRLDYDQLIAAVGGPQQPLGVVLRYLASELRSVTDVLIQMQRGG